MGFLATRDVSAPTEEEAKRLGLNLVWAEIRTTAPKGVDERSTIDIEGVQELTASGRIGMRPTGFTFFPE